MGDIGTDAYLARMGAERPARLDLAGLRYLQERHMMSVPFESVDFYIGEPVVLGEAAWDKIVRRRRGGGCYELNSAFGALLAALGFRVSLLAGRVLHNGLEPVRGALNGHMALRVDLDEPWLVDVGFRWASRAPLRFAERGPQADEHGCYQLVDTPEGDVELVHDGVHRYRLETRPRLLDDFDPTLWWFRTSPDSPMVNALWASLVTPTGRVSLLDRTLSRVENGSRTKTVLSDEEFLDALRGCFGVDLDRVPAKLPPVEIALTS